MPNDKLPYPPKLTSFMRKAVDRLADAQNMLEDAADIVKELGMQNLQKELWEHIDDVLSVAMPLDMLAQDAEGPMKQIESKQLSEVTLRSFSLGFEHDEKRRGPQITGFGRDTGAKITTLQDVYGIELTESTEEDDEE